MFLVLFVGANLGAIMRWVNNGRLKKIGLLIKGGRFTKPGKFPRAFKSETEHPRLLSVAEDRDPPWYRSECSCSSESGIR